MAIKPIYLLTLYSSNGVLSITASASLTLASAPAKSFISTSFIASFKGLPTGNRTCGPAFCAPAAFAFGPVRGGTAAWAGISAVTAVADAAETSAAIAARRMSLFMAFLFLLPRGRLGTLTPTGQPLYLRHTHDGRDFGPALAIWIL